MFEFDEPVSSAPLAFAATDLRFGDGVALDLPDVLSRRGIDEPLIVTDRGVEAAGLLDPVVDAIDASTTYYAPTEPATADFDDLPTGSIDGIVALGGGSCIDTAKIAAVLLAHGGRPAEYLGVDRVPGPIAPLIAIPTTSGTGSQATQTAVVTHDGVKRGVSDERLRPDAALVDPELTYELPRAVTARSGFDAFVHALESLLARDYRWVDPRPITYQGANPVSRALAWRALTLVHGSLEAAVFDGRNRDARRAMSLGSHLAGTAFSVSGLGAVHALASTLGGLTDRPHGECLAASIRPGLYYNLPVRREQYAAVAGALGVGSEPLALLEECDRLRAAVGLPGSFMELDLPKNAVDTIVENTLLQERRLATNPREVIDDLGEVLVDPDAGAWGRV